MEYYYSGYRRAGKRGREENKRKGVAKIMREISVKGKKINQQQQKQKTKKTKQKPKKPQHFK